MLSSRFANEILPYVVGAAIVLGLVFVLSAQKGSDSKAGDGKAPEDEPVMPFIYEM